MTSDTKIYTVKSGLQQVIIYNSVTNLFDDTTIPILPDPPDGNYGQGMIGACAADDSILYGFGNFSGAQTNAKGNKCAYSYDFSGYYLLWSAALAYGDCLLIEQPLSDAFYVVVHTPYGITQVIKGYWSCICAAGTWEVSMSKTMGVAYENVKVHTGVH